MVHGRLKSFVDIQYRVDLDKQDIMAPKKSKNSANSAQASTSKGSKRKQNANQKADDSPKRVKYDPSSRNYENRDKVYCKNFSLRAIRVPEYESEEEFSLVEEEVEFEGFNILEVDRRPALNNKTAILKARQAIIDEMVLSDPCSNNPDLSVPTAAPFDMVCDV